MKSFWAQVIMLLAAAAIHVVLIVDEVRHGVAPWISVIALITIAFWLFVLSWTQIHINRANRGRR